MQLYPFTSMFNSKPSISNTALELSRDASKAEKANTKNTVPLSERVNLLMGDLQKNNDSRYQELLFVLEYAMAQNHNYNYATRTDLACRSVFAYVEGKHFDLYDFLQNPLLPNTKNFQGDWDF